MKVWIVMVEQYYANNVDVLAICDSEEKAVEIKGSRNYAHIYEVEMNEEYPLA